MSGEGRDRRATFLWALAAAASFVAICAAGIWLDRNLEGFGLAPLISFVISLHVVRWQVGRAHAHRELMRRRRAAPLN